ncbi:MAG: phenylacetate--CoA ligase [Clostridia bacterium]
MNKIFDPANECMTRDNLEKLQSERLVKQIENVYLNVPAYAKKMNDAGIIPSDIKSIKDLSKLPFTIKQDLKDNYPFGLFAVPKNQIVRLHASSGTTGKLTVVGYTKHDLEIWSELMARAYTMAGATKEDIVHISYGYGLFTGGMGAHLGSEKIGAMTVPISTGNTARQIMLLKDFGATVLCCTPSYAIYIAEELEKLGIKPGDLALKVGVFGAEPWSEELRYQIEKRLGIKAFDIYGLSEIMGPGVAMECEKKCGLHIQEDHILAEIIDPETGKVLPDGEQGELVLTTITKEGIPMIRYRTRDIASLNHEKCECGRTTVRLNRISARTDDMLIIRGVNVFPSQIETVLLKYQTELNPQYQIIVTKNGALDNLEIQVEVSKNFADMMKIEETQKAKTKILSDGTVVVEPIESLIENLKQRLNKDIESMLGISAKITLLPNESLPRSEGKAKRVFDHRNILG